MRKVGILFVLAVVAVVLVKRTSKAAPIHVGLASLKQSEVVVYAGPTRRSPKLWKMHHKDWAVYVLETTKNWAKIQDAYETVGWVEKRNIGPRYGLILENCEVIFHDKKEEVKVQLLKNSCVKILKIEGEECLVQVSGKMFMINKKLLWLGPVKK